MKIAGMTMAFNAPTIGECIDNMCAYWLDKIYVAYSTRSRNYNAILDNKFTKDEVLNMCSPEKRDAVVFVEGVRDKDHETRNSIMEQAKKDGIDYLIIQDADEFYHPDFLEKIKPHLNHDSLKCPMYYFWDKWYILYENATKVFENYPEICIKVSDEIKFVNGRNSNRFWQAYIVPDLISYHLSYVLDNEFMKLKILTRWHSHEIVKNWYENVRSKRTVDSRNLHPVNPWVRYKAGEYDINNLPLQAQNVCNKIKKRS